MEKRCLGCMRIKTRSPLCEHCGFDENSRNEVHQLSQGTVLQGRYTIGRVLGQGGFGITYLGWDSQLGSAVAIKEYYPRGDVSRNISMSATLITSGADEKFREGRERFLREARTLGKLRNLQNIVQVYNSFEDNNTAYIAMEYVEGITLLEYIRQRGGRLTTSETFAILRPVMRALHQVHEAGMIHRDISPDNIMLQDNGTVKLLDFGTARDVDSSGQMTHSTQAVLKHGFAPMEQYASGRGVDRRADEYALCATAYYCLTGRVPQDAPTMIMDGGRIRWEGVPGLTEQQRTALTRGTAFRAEDRYENLLNLEAAVFGTAPKPRSQPVPPTQTETAPSPAKKRKLRKRWVIAAVMALYLALCGLLAVLRPFGGDEETVRTPPQTTAQPQQPEDLPQLAETLPELPRRSEEVAVFWYTYKDSYLTNIRAAMDQQAADLGWTVQSYDANNDPTLQLDQIQMAIAQGVSCLLVNIVQAEDGQAVVDMAMAADIPVVFFNRRVPETVVRGYEKASLVVSDYTMAGRVQGGMIGNYLLENYETVDLDGDGKITYVLFSGPEDNPEANARTKYCLEEINRVLEAAGRPAVISGTEDAYIDAGWMAAKSQEEMLSFLVYGYLVELVIAGNDDMALGALNSLEVAGLAVPVFGIDGGENARKRIDAGEMTGTVAPDSAGLVEATVTLAKNLMSGEEKFQNLGSGMEVSGGYCVNVPYAPYMGG